MHSMSWINVIASELPRMRLYASASLGSPVDGDLAVEEALGAFFITYLPGKPDRMVLFRLLDLGLRSTTAMPDSEREELLKHVAGFDPSETGDIVEWDPTQSLMRSAG